MPNPKKRAEKQEAASSRKSAAESAQKAAQEDQDWSRGAKGTSKAEREAEKKAEQQRKKEEKARLEAEESAALPSKPTGKVRGADKAAIKKSNKIDDALFSAAPEKKVPGLTATNIDDALDALAITGKSTKKISTSDIDKHPERRFKAAYAAFEERRINEMKAEKSGLRLQQMKDAAYKEFQKSPENPFNQLTADHNATREDLQEIAKAERQKTERRLETR